MPNRPFWPHFGLESRMMRIPPATHGAHAHQVVGRKAHQRLSSQLGLTLEFGLGQSAHGLLAPAAPLAPQHLERRLVLCRAIGVGDLHVHRQAVAVVHQDVAHVAQLRLVALGFLVQARIGVGAAGMGVVAALLAFEVDFGVAPRGRGWVVVVVAVVDLVVAVFALEALVRRPSLDQGAVDAEVLVADEPRPVGAVLDALEEHARQVFVEQALAVGAEGGVIPDLVFDAQAHEPAIQQVVVDGLDQQPLAADGEQDLQQQGFQEHLGWHRRAAFARIHGLELGAHAGQQGIDQRPQLAQGVLGRHPVFKADGAEHGSLKALHTSHRKSPINARCRDAYDNTTGAGAGSFSTAC